MSLAFRLRPAGSPVRRTPSRLVGCLAGLAGLLLTPLAAAQPTLVVSPGDNIQAALDNPTTFEVVMQPGLYPGTYTVPLGKHLRGATGDRTDVVIDNTSGLTLSVLTALPGARISNLTVRNGRAVGATPNDRGGGINAPLGSVFIHNVSVQSCIAAFGGGIYMNGTGAITGDTEVADCDATASGGGIYLNNFLGPVNVNCHLNRSSGTGGAIRTNGGEPVITDSSFRNNITAVNQPGGAIDVRGAIIIDRCKFESNIGGNGGAIRIDGEAFNREIRNSLFTNNFTDFEGGAIYGGRTVDIHNCTFYANGSYNDGTSAVSMDPNTGPMTMRSCIVWASPDAAPISPTINCNWSVVDAGFNASAIRTGDPMFVNVAARDFRLQPGSSAIDFGLTALLDFWTVGGQTPQTEFSDLRGSIRAWNVPEVENLGSSIIGMMIDCGAYEFFPPTDLDGTCPEDINTDGNVDFVDLLNVLSAFGSCP
ncbi:MAG: hypothetical protein AB8G96_08630 [Phycisphaerales bacterium]